MATSPRLRSELDPQPRKLSFAIKRRQKKFGPTTLTILAALLILMPGCANFRSSTAIDQRSRIDDTWEVSSHTPADLSAPLKPAAISEIGEPPARAELLVRQNVSIPTSLPEPTFTLEPTAPPTRAIVAIVTPTPSASPTATQTPPATATPIATPPATPTAASLPAADQSLPPLSEPGINHVVIISVDGLRPDALALADTPTLDKLIAGGAYSPHAQTVDPSVTLPSHASMLSGMLPEKHGIVWGMPYIGWPGMNGPTLFSVAHEAGLSTGMVFGKHKLNYLVLPNSVDRLFGEDMHDPEVKDGAVKIIQAGLPNALFIHFPDTDRVGHAYGWMSENQGYAITFVDGLIGEIVTELEKGDYLSRTLLIVTADHGGHGQGHGDDSPLDRTIPWLAVGPGVPQGATLTSHINTYDTAATALHALKLPIPENWDGRPVLEIFQ